MRRLTEEERANPEIADMVDDLGKISAITVIGDSQGGKILVKSLVSDVVGNVDTLCAKYSTLSLQEFISLCADMKSKLDLIRVITRARKNKKSLEAMIGETLGD